MKYRESALLNNRALIKPAACLTLALSGILWQHQVLAGAYELKADGIDPSFFVWCHGDGQPHPGVPFTADTMPTQQGLPKDDFEPWGGVPVLTNWQTGSTSVGFGRNAETAAPSDPNQKYDRYALQLNYWNSIANANTTLPDGTPIPTANRNADAPFGYSTGQLCMTGTLDNNTPDPTKQVAGQFTINYPANAPAARPAEIMWAMNNSTSYPWFGFAPYSNGSTSGGPTSYVSTFKGCSWDGNSCTDGSKIPSGPSVQITKSTDHNVFPEKLADVTSIPTSWTIEFSKFYGSPIPGDNTHSSGAGQKDNTLQAWDAAYDIWFDKTGHTAEGFAPYASDGSARGQNDGLEIMVWLNHNGSYVDGPQVGADGYHVENQTGYIQPTGHIRERVVINGVLYDVWAGRLNNPYFSYRNADPTKSTTKDPNVIIGPTQEPYECPALKTGGLCGVSWNVVSFVATQDPASGRDYRNTTISTDAKVFTDYILGIQDGQWSVVATTDAYTRGLNGGALLCPNTVLIKDPSYGSIGGPVQYRQVDSCLDPNWYLMSVQAGFETWIGGAGLQSDKFSTYVETMPLMAQSGRFNGNFSPWLDSSSPSQAVYTCASGTANLSQQTASFYIEGKDASGKALYYPGVVSQTPTLGPIAGIYAPLTFSSATQQFVASIPALSSMRGNAIVHFRSSCDVDKTTRVYFDSTGKVFYSDGKTPVPNAQVTLQYSTSGTANGPYVNVPDRNVGLSNAILQSDGIIANPMASTVSGAYGWDPVPGWYRVAATAPGCSSVVSGNLQVTATNPLKNINLNLSCAAPPAPPTPSPVTAGVTVQLTDNGTQANPRYCKNLIVTNNNNFPVTWKVQFNLPYPGHIDTAQGGYWNFNYTASGNTITAWGVDWNKTLAAKATSNSIGFCAYKN